MSVTPFQTLGPYFDVLLRSRHRRPDLPPDAAGRIVLRGRLFDGAGAPVADGLIELWQADSHGRYAHPDDPESAQADPSFYGYRWCHTGGDGGFAFTTVKPGRARDAGGGLQAPHILVSVTARGILTRYITRVYFAHEQTNDEDAVLALVPEARRHTLIARAAGESTYEFNILLQGPNETIFFDV